uniref:VP11 n=1 Tax=viral metagenome TaxID=1070528 RepID=A0A2V0RNQ1_9ZZZZ
MSTRVNITKLTEEWRGPEVILLRIKASARVYHEQYRRAYLAFRHRLMYFDIPIIVFSSVNSVLIAGGKNFLQPDLIEVTTCMLALVTGIIQALRTFLKIDETRENCLVTYKDLFRLFCEVSTILAQPLRSRSVDAQKFMLDKIAEFKEIMDKAVILEEKTKSNPIYLDGLTWDVGGVDESTDSSSPRRHPDAHLSEIPSLEFSSIKKEDYYDDGADGDAITGKEEANMIIATQEHQTPPVEYHASTWGTNNRRNFLDKLPDELQRHIYSYAFDVVTYAWRCANHTLPSPIDLSAQNTATPLLIHALETNPRVSTMSLIHLMEEVRITSPPIIWAMSDLGMFLHNRDCLNGNNGVLHPDNKPIVHNAPLDRHDIAGIFNLFNQVALILRLMSIVKQECRARNKLCDGRNKCFVVREQPWITGHAIFDDVNYRTLGCLQAAHRTVEVECGPLRQGANRANHVRVHCIMQIELIFRAYMQGLMPIGNYQTLMKNTCALFASTYGVLTLHEIIVNWHAHWAPPVLTGGFAHKRVAALDKLRALISKDPRSRFMSNKVKKSDMTSLKGIAEWEMASGAAIAGEVLRMIRYWDSTVPGNDTTKEVVGGTLAIVNGGRTSTGLILCPRCQRASVYRYKCTCSQKFKTSKLKIVLPNEFR